MEKDRLKEKKETTEKGQEWRIAVCSSTGLGRRKGEEAMKSFEEVFEV